MYCSDGAIYSGNKLLLKCYLLAPINFLQLRNFDISEVAINIIQNNLQRDLQWKFGPHLIRGYKIGKEIYLSGQF